MLQGSLDNFGLHEVLGLLADTAKSGRMRITGDRGAGSLWLADGQLIGSEASRAVADGPIEETMFELLRFVSGNFSFTMDESPSRSLDPRPVADVLEAARQRLAQWREIEAVVPSLAHIVAPVAMLPVPEITIAADEWELLMAIGSGAEVGSICEHFGLGEVDGSNRVKQLIERQLIEIAPPVAARFAVATPVGVHDLHEDTDDFGLAPAGLTTELAPTPVAVDAPSPEAPAPTPDAFAPAPIDAFSPAPIDAFAPSPADAFSSSPTDAFSSTPAVAPEPAVPTAAASPAPIDVSFALAPEAPAESAPAAESWTDAVWPEPAPSFDAAAFEQADPAAVDNTSNLDPTLPPGSPSFDAPAPPHVTRSGAFQAPTFDSGAFAPPAHADERFGVAPLSERLLPPTPSFLDPADSAGRWTPEPAPVAAPPASAPVVEGRGFGLRRRVSDTAPPPPPPPPAPTAAQIGDLYDAPAPPPPAPPSPADLVGGERIEANEARRLIAGREARAMFPTDTEAGDAGLIDGTEEDDGSLLMQYLRDER